MKTITLELTPEQTALIENFWSAHGTFGAAMIAQPISRNSRYLFRIGILSPDHAEQVAGIIAQAKGQS